MDTQKSKVLYERSIGHIPGGVNSPVRFFKPYPFFTSHASGSKLYDVDGNAYLDYCLAYGSVFLGHAAPEIIAAVSQQLQKGTVYGTPTEAEVKLSEIVADIIPCMQSLRLVNSGTEATMHAIRLARGYTGKDKIIKFEGCYHGAHDSVLVKAGSGAATFGVSSSLGVTQAVAKNTIVLPFNNVELFEDTVCQNRETISSVIVEPVIGNAGVILPQKNYLHDLRRITKENGILLIFDEVITGFRLALGGAQEYFGVEPDLVTLGKILGGGFPIGAYGGKKDIMEDISPLGNVYQAGTMSGNPISVTAGLATLSFLGAQKDKLYSRLTKNGERISKGIRDYAKDAELDIQVNCIGSMFQMFFTSQLVTDYQTAQSSNKTLFMNYQKMLMNEGVFIPPSQFETCFLSSAHTDEDIDKTLESIDSALKGCCEKNKVN
jgi:glutamate-1-semialdehyde 2,1-aminomutase